MNLYAAVKNGDVFYHELVAPKRTPMEPRDVAMIYEAVKDDAEEFMMFMRELSVEETEALHDYMVEKAVATGAHRTMERRFDVA